MLEFDKKTPVLFLVFNRPDTTARVFEEIRKAQPLFLYIAADGARNEREQIIVNEVRSIIEKIDWDCKVKTLFRDTNLGCRKAVSEAVSWFFEQEVEGIVLEDDCLPSQSFFGFCAEMLARFRNDEGVTHIGGANFQDGIQRGNASYYFSRLTHVWGWAGWRRVWKSYDPDMNDFDDFKKSDALKQIPSFKMFKDIWLQNLEKVRDKEIDTWDYQYAYLNIKTNGFSIIPNENLIKNIGFGIGATNTTKEHILRVENLSEITKIIHPEEVIVNIDADIYTQKKEFSHIPAKKSILSRTWKAVKNALRNEK